MKAESKEGLAWAKLGATLTTQLDASIRRANASVGEHLARLFTALGVDETDTIRASIRERSPDWGDADLRMRALTGELGDKVRRAAIHLSAFQGWRRIWEWQQEEREALAIEDEEEAEAVDPWQAFWEGVAESQPRLECESLAGLDPLAEEATAAENDALSRWPLESLGRTEADILGDAFRQVRARTGVAMNELPVDPSLEDSPAMALTSASEACLEIRDWIVEREVWCRALERLRPFMDLDSLP